MSTKIFFWSYDNKEKLYTLNVGMAKLALKTIPFKDQDLGTETISKVHLNYRQFSLVTTHPQNKPPTVTPAPNISGPVPKA